MKIQRLGKAGKMIAINEDGQALEWYVIGDDVKSYINDLKQGDPVTIKYELKNNSKVLMYIKKLDGTGNAGSAPAKASVSQQSYGRTPADNESIKRQAMAHATSRTMISLQGQVNESNIEQLMERIYKKYQELVG
jgi:hypothetical protein